MATTEVSDRTVRLRGNLSLHLAPQHLRSSTGRGMEPECLLLDIYRDFPFQQPTWRPVEYILRLKAARPAEEEQAESSTSKERMLLDSLTPKEAALFDSSCLVQAVLYDATMEMTDLKSPDDDAVITDLTSPSSDDDDDDDDDAVEIAELPTRHIFLREGEMGKPLVQRAVKRHVVTLGLLSLQEAVRHLPAFLADLPPSASLRHVVIFGMDNSNAHDLDRLTAALIRSSLVEGVSVMDWPIGDAELPFLVRLFNSMTYIRIAGAGLAGLEEGLRREAGESNAFKVKQLSVADGFWKVTSALEQLNAALLTRLDARHMNRLNFVPGFGGAERSLANLQSLNDVGLSIPDSRSLMGLFDAKLHTKIIVLRLTFIFSEEEPLIKRAWKLLIMDDDSTVQFFDCSLLIGTRYSAFHGLAGNETPAALTALKVRHYSLERESYFSTDLAKYLCSPAASNLVYLDVGGASEEKEREFREAMTDWEVANSLVNHFNLCTFAFPFKETAAESYAIRLLHRNRLYRDSLLLTEPQVKPNVAKLFLCGHGRVGKTTLRLALQSMQNFWSKSLSVLNVLGLRNSRTDPTRGMETHFLPLQGSHEKLLICDLAGQEEFHVFHHYFMNASINDIFVVVCKYNTGTSLHHFKLQLEYWLRFIVSHRSTRNKSFRASEADHTQIKPKVIVVVNFFQHCQQEIGDGITRTWTRPSMQKFSEILDFAAEDWSQQHIEFKNLIWLNARTGFRVQMLGQRLKFLLSNFRNAAMPIPKLCYDISAHLTQARGKKGLFANTLAAGKAKSRLLMSYSEILEVMSKHAAVHQSSRVQAALQELHTQGYVIFFPSEEIGGAHGRSNSMHGELVGEDRIEDTLVITDTNWFSNKLVGSLLGTHLPDAPKRPCPWKWEVEEVKHMLRIHGCAEHHLEEILRYLEHLELCVSLDSVPGAEKGFVLFPALVKNEEIPFPEESKERSRTFFGRRTKCTDPSIQLIPFGIFTRLQVKLHKAYAPRNDSFEIGYGWVSFRKGRVGVVVTFGGDAINDTGESKQWIDIFIFCRDDCGSNENSGGRNPGYMSDPKLIAAEAMVAEIRSHLYLTCKEGGLGGIPTVTMEEMVLLNETESSPSVCLSEILDKARTQGLQDSYQEWKRSPSTRVRDLLFPTEIEGLVKGRLNVLATIQEEFCEGVEDDDGGSGEQLEQDADKQESGDAISESPLPGDLGILENRMKSYFEVVISKAEAQSAMLKNIDKGVQMVREDFTRLGDVLLQAEQEIIANCTTRLLRHELRKDRAYPLYPYLVDVEGKLTPLWEAMFGRRVVRVHFLCESPAEGGPHLVEGQKGKEVSIDWKPWVKKVARVMVPALKVIYCLAKVAASVYLPSAHVFIPSPEFLMGGLGFEREALQHVILPRALEALLKDLPDVDLKDLMRCRPREQEVQEVVAAILQNKKVDMWEAFSLKRVIFDDEQRSTGAALHRTFWVCDRHARHKTEAIQIKNPYSS